MFPLLAFGCGGGGASAAGTSEPAGPVLRWSPPQSYTDQTPLDPAKDLSEYIIYVNDTGVFSASTPSSAVLGAIDPATGNPATSFNLGKLAPSLSSNVTYYVSMQSVSNTGGKSAFSPPASFSF